MTLQSIKIFNFSLSETFNKVLDFLLLGIKVKVLISIIGVALLIGFFCLFVGNTYALYIISAIGGILGLIAFLSNEPDDAVKLFIGSFLIYILPHATIFPYLIQENASLKPVTFVFVEDAASFPEKGKERSLFVKIYDKTDGEKIKEIEYPIVESKIIKTQYIGYDSIATKTLYRPFVSIETVEEFADSSEINMKAKK